MMKAETLRPQALTHTRRGLGRLFLGSAATLAGRSAFGQEANSESAAAELLRAFTPDPGVMTDGDVQDVVVLTRLGNDPFGTRGQAFANITEAAALLFPNDPHIAEQWVAHVAPLEGVGGYRFTTNEAQFSAMVARASTGVAYEAGRGRPVLLRSTTDYHGEVFEPLEVFRSDGTRTTVSTALFDICGNWGVKLHDAQEVRETCGRRALIEFIAPINTKFAVSIVFPKNAPEAPASVSCMEVASVDDQCAVDGCNYLNWARQSVANHTPFSQDELEGYTLYLKAHENLTPASNDPNGIAQYEIPQYVIANGRTVDLREGAVFASACMLTDVEHEGRIVRIQWSRRTTEPADIADGHHRFEWATSDRIKTATWSPESRTDLGPAGD